MNKDAGIGDSYATRKFRKLVSEYPLYAAKRLLPLAVIG